MYRKADESIVAKTQAALIEFDPDEEIDELALRKTAYYLQFGYLGVEAPNAVQAIWPDDGSIYEIYYIIKFTQTFSAECGHQAYGRVEGGIIACVNCNCNNYYL